MPSETLIAGLAAARHALDTWAEVEVVIFEEAGDVGGLWNPHRPSAVYPHLRTNAPSLIMELEGRQQIEPEDSSFLPRQVKLKLQCFQSIFWGEI
jgi:cation diffusion facilitator CzcD-associated flavoprotein CzcO